MVARRVGVVIVLIVLLSLVPNLNAQEQPSPDSNLVYITAVAWSPNGNAIAVAQDATVQIIDIITGLATSQIVASGNHIRVMDWSPDGRKLALGVDTTVQIWEIGAENPLLVFQEHGTRDNDRVSSLGWSPDGSKIVSASMQNGLLWDTQTGEVLHRFSHNPGPLLSARWSPDGTRIATGGLDSIVLFWDVASGAILGGINMPYAPEVNPIIYVNWSPNGSLIATASADRIVRVWDGTTNNPINSTDFRGLEDDAVSLDWNRDNRSLARSGLGGEIRIFDVLSGATVATFNTDFVARSIDYSPYGGRLAYGGIVGRESTIAMPAGAQTLANGAVQIIVPAPSFERLASVQAACVPPEVGLTAPQDPAGLDAYIAQVQALPPEQLPPGCAADLLAVARALRAQ